MNARLSKALHKILRNLVVSNDESYVLPNLYETLSRQFFHAKYSSKEKPEEKINIHYDFLIEFLVSQKLDQFGYLCEPYVYEGCMNLETYLKEIAINQLIPLIK